MEKFNQIEEIFRQYNNLSEAIQMLTQEDLISDSMKLPNDCKGQHIMMTLLDFKEDIKKLIVIYGSEDEITNMRGLKALAIAENEI